MTIPIQNVVQNETVNEAVFDNEVLRHTGVVPRDRKPESELTLQHRRNIIERFAAVVSRGGAGAVAGGASGVASGGQGGRGLLSGLVPQVPTEKPKRLTGRFARLYTARCETHGEYECNQIVSGYEVWLPPGCPVCRKDLINSRVSRTLAIPRRYENCSFENYQIYDDGQFAPSVAICQYARDFERHFNEGTGLVFVGHKGTGKNHLAYSVAKEVMMRGFTVQFFTYSDLLEKSYGIELAQRNEWIEVQTSEPDLLILDELGRNSVTEPARRRFFDIINRRHNDLKPTILISNFSVDDLKSPSMFGEEVWSRILQTNQVFRFDWADKRSMVLLDSDGSRV